MKKIKVAIDNDPNSGTGVPQELIERFERGESLGGCRVIPRDGMTALETAFASYKARKKRQKKAVSIYLYESDIAKARVIAEQTGIGYQTVIAETLHDALA